MTTRFLLYLCIVLISFLIGIVKFSKLNVAYKLVTFLLVYTFFSEIGSRILAAQIKNSSPIYHLYIPVQFCFLYLSYLFLFGIRNKLSLILIPSLFFLFSILNLLFLQNRFRFPSNTILISSCFFIIMALLFFRKMLNSINYESIFKQDIFWFNSSILISFTISFLFWGFYNYLLSHKISTKPISTIVYVINIICYSMLGVALALTKNNNALNECHE